MLTSHTELAPVTGKVRIHSNIVPHTELVPSSGSHGHHCPSKLMTQGHLLTSAHCELSLHHQSLSTSPVSFIITSWILTTLTYRNDMKISTTETSVTNLQDNIIIIDNLWDWNIFQ